MKKKKQGSLLGRWKSRRQTIPSQTIPKIAKGSALVLSYGQQRLWLLQQLNPGNPFYNYSEAFVLDGDLDVKSLHAALQAQYDLHDILRTTYRVENDKLLAVVGPKEKLPLGQYDISSGSGEHDQDRLDEILLSDAAKPFDLKNGPVIRVSLYRVSQDRHILSLNLHHIAIDRWSMDIFRQELAKSYRLYRKGGSFDIEPARIQYQDFAAWQRDNPIEQRHIDYWLEKLSGDTPVVQLPKDNPAPLQPTYKGSFYHHSHSEELSKALLDLATQLGSTPYVLLLSVYYVLLFRYTGQNDILVGSPISNRDRKALEGLIGFFLNTVVLRINLEGDLRFTELVALVKTTALEAFDHGKVPFDRLVKALKPGRSSNLNPFFNHMFLYNRSTSIPDFGPDLEFSEFPFDSKVSKFDLTLHMVEENGRLKSMFEYATDIFERGTIERLQTHFDLLLKGIVADPSQKIAEIPMLSPFEKEFFFDKGHRPLNIDSRLVGIHEIIGKMALLHPNKPAVTFGGETLTYAELDRKALATAVKVMEITKGRNKIVGLCIERSTDMVVGLVGILKAGSAYLPLDPDYPLDRVQFMVKDADVTLIVTNDRTLSKAAEYGSEILNISELGKGPRPSETVLPKVKASDWAYVIYTSGSSGKPKGVPISHKGIVNSTLGRTAFYGHDPEAFLLMSSISFDSSKAGIFWTLCTGGNLVISEKRLEQDIDRLALTIRENRISHTLMLPSLYQMLLEHGDKRNLEDIKAIIVAGEACTTGLCAKHFETLPEIELYNEYGPTEATVWCTAHRITKNDTNSVPIGRPVAASEIYLLDHKMNLVPYGAIGEIYVGGEALSGEYLNRPDLTKSAYVTSPFGKETNSRLYKTGDLARYNPDGNIEFMGRADNQVKIRGFRIELGEIEKAIQDYGSVEKAVVLIEEPEFDFAEIADLETDELLTKLEHDIGFGELDRILTSVENLSEEEQYFLLDKF